MSQAREKLVSKYFILTEIEADLANKEKELAARVMELTRKQEELDWEPGERTKARVEVAEVVKKKNRMEKVVLKA